MKKALFTLMCLLTYTIMAACNISQPSQVERDTQATDAATEIPATPTAETPTPTNAPTNPPTSTPASTSTPTPPSTLMPTAGPTDAPTAAPSPQPATESPPTAPAATVPPPSSGVVAAFLTDARQTQDDLMAVKVWFDRLAGGETIPCATVYGHGIHLPSSMAPGQVADLVPIWNEYQVAIADGQQCLQWLVDFCNAGGGNIGAGDFWNRRDLSSSALSHCEHVVQALEASQ
jgi:hypothetical protein